MLFLRNDDFPVLYDLNLKQKVKSEDFYILLFLAVLFFCMHRKKTPDAAQPVCLKHSMQNIQA